MGSNPDTDAKSKVFANDLLMNAILSNLDVTSLKSTRYLCSRWRLLSHPHFVEKSVCCISSPLQNSRISTFNSCFPDAYYWSFSKFRLSGEFSPKEFETFFNARKNLKEVTLCKPTFPRCDLLETVTWKWEVSSKLCIDYIGENYFLDIKLSSLKNTETIILQGNALMAVSMDAKISPTHLSIIGDVTLVTFFDKDGVEMTQVSLTEFIDPQNLMGLVWTNNSPKVIVDLSNYLKMQYLEIGEGTSETEIIGWNERLIIKFLRLDMPNVDISVLPTSLELLMLYGGDSTFITPKVFPYLESLFLKGSIPPYNHFPTLRRLLLLEGNLNTDSLPASVSKLSLIMGPVTGGKIVSVDTLGMADRWELISDAVSRFNATTLVVMIAFTQNFNEILEDNVYNQVFSIAEKQMRKGGRFVVDLEHGGVLTDMEKDTLFQRSKFANVFDERSDCYCFEDNQGEVITTEEFQEAWKHAML